MPINFNAQNYKCKFLITQPNSLFLSIYKTTEKKSTIPASIKSLSTISLLPNLVISLVDISTCDPIVFISVLESLSTAEELTLNIRK